MSEGAGPKKKKQEGGGAPGWVVTFSDLMSQLMCFFVLILSFADNDTKTYIEYVSKIDRNMIKVNSGTTDFPNSNNLIGIAEVLGIPQPTLLDVDTSQDKTTDSDTNNVKIIDRKFLDGASGSNVNLDIQDRIKEVKGVLAEEIKNGLLEIFEEDKNIVIRLRDSTVFVGSTILLRGDFYPLLEKVRMIIAQLEGNVEVVGYSDDKQVNDTKYSSNWEFSSARASTIANELLKTKELDKSRFLVTGYGDTRSLMPNTDDDNRDRNNRVEIIIHQPKDKPIGFDKKTMPIGAQPFITPDLPFNQQPAVEKNNFQRIVP